MAWQASSGTVGFVKSARRRRDVIKPQRFSQSFIRNETRSQVLLPLPAWATGAPARAISPLQYMRIPRRRHLHRVSKLPSYLS